MASAVRYVEIIEQPQKSVRFRYESEGRFAGSLEGISSTDQTPTFPTIQVVGYKGPAKVILSLVTKDGPRFKPHPHKLVGRHIGCKDGVCFSDIPTDTMTISFPNLGIQCVKKKSCKQALDQRRAMRINPFNAKFTEHDKIDIHAVRLCFQVFTNEIQPNVFNCPLPPVVSDIIFDDKAVNDLKIVELSHPCMPASGNQNMILLCEKVNREDIEIRFFEIKPNGDVWQAKGQFEASQVHYQTAISFKVPPYERLDIEENVSVWIQLKKKSDGTTSDPLPFQYIPNVENLKPRHFAKSKQDRMEDRENYLESFRSREVMHEDYLNLISFEPKYGLECAIAGRSGADVHNLQTTMNIHASAVNTLPATLQITKNALPATVNTLPRTGHTLPLTLNTFPVNTLPVNTLPVNILPVNTLPVNTLPVNTLPVNTLPVNALPANALPVNALPVNTLPGAVNTTIPNNILATTNCISASTNDNLPTTIEDFRIENEQPLLYNVPFYTEEELNEAVANASEIISNMSLESMNWSSASTSSGSESLNRFVNTRYDDIIT